MTGLPPELVAAVLADFGGDAPRLACADWLEEHGDPDAARLARLQCRLARRVQLRLSTVEYSRGNAEVSRLILANEERWLAPLAEARPNRVVTATWERGFVSYLGIRRRHDTRSGPPEPPGTLARLAAAPLATRLDLVGLAPVPPAMLDELPDLPRLHALALPIDPGGGDLPDTVLVRLADYPRLDWIQLLAPRPRGELVNVIAYPHLLRLLELRCDRLRAVPDAELLAALEPSVDHLRRATGGRVGLAHERVLPLDPAVMARVPGLVCLGLDAPELPEWVARHADTLRTLEIDDLERFGDPDAGPWRDLRDGLTALHVLQARLSADEWERAVRFAEAAPRLASLTLGAAEGYAGPTAGQFERLARLGRVRRLASGFDGPAVKQPSRELAGERQDAGGVSLRLPTAFARRASTPAIDVEILGEWAEWGDGDPSDRLHRLGPAWLTLERLNFPVRIGDAARLLTGPPGDLAEPHAWTAARRVATPRGPAHRVEGWCAFARHWRWLWPGRAGGLRLRLEVPTGRAEEWGGVGDEIAASVGA